ncbi:hypothetical protein [Wohlfahrtiimonas sp. G9077]|uniref:hypothetical protein n=1 Tax=Wohlfahrtiimonas sp. G9077 TaxID=1980118 RepID=UPI000B97FA5D|nr:hypothetical protein [Wohlfahrtiimonas sp. G9077]OYQ72978.1 hypothetical protein B9T20_08575 [Wohlfahrtiimonas sp. G9077]
MIKQERFYQLFNSLPQTEKDHIVRTAIELSAQFQNNSVTELMRACHYHATEAMRTFRLKKQRIHHATRYAALRYAMMCQCTRTLHAA